jgi:hypothetical protein
MRLNQPPEIGQVGQLALASQQETAELVLELLDRARQRRLRDIAQLRRPREAQGLRHCQEVADLMHFHARNCRGLLTGRKSQRREG